MACSKEKIKEAINEMWMERLEVIGIVIGCILIIVVPVIYILGLIAMLPNTPDLTNGIYFAGAILAFVVYSWFIFSLGESNG